MCLHRVWNIQVFGSYFKYLPCLQKLCTTKASISKMTSKPENPMIRSTNYHAQPLEVGFNHLCSNWHFQCFVLLALVGAAVAIPVPDDAPVRAYGPPVPVPAYGKPVEDLPPQPYQYEYGVSDQYSGSNYQAVESQDPQGTVLGNNLISLNILASSFLYINVDDVNYIQNYANSCYISFWCNLHPNIFKGLSWDKKSPQTTLGFSKIFI